MKVTIVSSADSVFFHFLQDLVRSIRDKPEAAEVDISILDVGLAEDEVAWLSDHATAVVVPDWDFDYSKQKVVRDHMRSLTARPFLPKYFPGYDIYVYIDADAWVQDWFAVELLIEAAACGALGIVPQAHPDYRITNHMCKRKRILGLSYYKPTFHFVRYIEIYGVDIARRMMNSPVLNGGVFSLSRTAPHWDVWADRYQYALERSRGDGLDQITVNYVAHIDALKIERLPALCNWACHFALPKLDSESGRFIEPSLPNRTIGIIHMTNISKRGEQDIATTDGGFVRRSLRYPGREAASAARHEMRA